MLCFNSFKRWTRQQRDHRLMLRVCALSLVKRLQRKIRVELLAFKRRCMGRPKVILLLARVGHLFKDQA